MSVRLHTFTHLHAARLLAWLCALLAVVLPAMPAAAQGEPEPTPDAPVDGGADAPAPDVQPVTAAQAAPGVPTPADFGGSLQVLRGPAGAPGPAAPGGGPEIFPDASRVWMSVRDTNPIPIEAARRGGKWLCSDGHCAAQNGDPGRSSVGDQMLRSIKLQTPTLPLPLTIWGRQGPHGERLLDFDPVLLGRRSYRHVCAYRPIADAPGAAPSRSQNPTLTPAAPAAKGPKKADKVSICRDGKPERPSPDSGELTLGMQWPRQSEMADFHYLAIVDSCGNARVQPFQRTFTVPVFEVASGGCGRADGKVLRIFPSGGWIRVTAFNLDAPAAANVVNVTYRVTIPPLENLVESNPARLLFPDPLLDDLKVDCGPIARKAGTGPGGIPQAPPGAPPPGAAARGAAPPGAIAPGPTRPQGAKAAAAAPTPFAPGPAPPPARAPPDLEASGPGPQPLAHESLVISPTPLRQGNCKVRLLGQTKRRLVAPLALYVSLTRTDRTINGAPIELLPDGKWIVTPNAAEFNIPPLSESFDGDSRLRLTVHSDPLSADGKVVLLSDAARVATSLRTGDSGDPERARRLVGSVTIHSVPLCGESNFETLDAAGSCLRAYLTVPAMLATLQITRAPWVEKPLITRSVLSAVGVALAIDSYDPVERRAFPIAAQLGGFVQTLGEGKVGLLAYVGVAPTIPILGTGGNTTSFGFLGGVGIEYITNESGPDEGLKPAAFLSVVVQVGQATPQASASGRASFGSYAGE